MMACEGMRIYLYCIFIPYWGGAGFLDGAELMLEGEVGEGSGRESRNDVCIPRLVAAGV